MTALIFSHIRRFLFLLILQVIVLRWISFGWEGARYFHVILYPLFIILLPLRTHRIAMLILAFLLGILVDIFYDSPGVHASAIVFIAYIRPYVLSFLKPVEGYNLSFSPTMKRFGLPWFFWYASIMMIAHLFFYFSMEAFTFAYIGSILLKTVLSYLISMGFVMFFMFIVNPED